jgi:hypothetical protein
MDGMHVNIGNDVDGGWMGEWNEESVSMTWYMYMYIVHKDASITSYQHRMRGEKLAFCKIRRAAMQIVDMCSILFPQMYC